MGITCGSNPDGGKRPSAIRASYSPHQVRALEDGGGV